MTIDAEQRAMLTRMETAHTETARHLAVIERQIEARAERMTTSSRVKARQFGRACQIICNYRYHVVGFERCLLNCTADSIARIIASGLATPLPAISNAVP